MKVSRWRWWFRGIGRAITAYTVGLLLTLLGYTAAYAAGQASTHLWPLSVLAQATPAPTSPVPDLVTFLSTASPLSIIVFFMWGFIIKNPPLFVPWRYHQDALDTIERLNRQLDRYNSVAGAAVDRLPGDGGIDVYPSASTSRVNVRKRGDGNGPAN